MNYISLDMAFQALLGLASAGFWMYVKNLSDRMKDATEERFDIYKQIAQVRESYQSRDEARREFAQMMDLLKEIKADLRDVAEKLEKKADK